MATPRNIIGPQLRRLRVNKGMSQQALAEMLQLRGWDVSRGVIARIEGQVRWVADFELLVLAESLSVEVEWFLSEKRVSETAHKMARELQHGRE